MAGENQAPLLFENLKNTMGNRMSAEFLNFLTNYKLTSDDPNYQ